jgi:hypothetical protein
VAVGDGEMSFRGYWYVRVESPETKFGKSCTTRLPSPGAEDDFGKGEAIKISSFQGGDRECHYSQEYKSEMCVNCLPYSA